MSLMTKITQDSIEKRRIASSSITSVISELYFYTMRSHKGIYITALDRQNAFSSIGHDMIIQCLQKSVFVEDFE